jgi:hypothetical protein
MFDINKNDLINVVKRGVENYLIEIKLETPINTGLLVDSWEIIINGDDITLENKQNYASFNVEIDQAKIEYHIYIEFENFLRNYE